MVVVEEEKEEERCIKDGPETETQDHATEKCAAQAGLHLTCTAA